MYLLHTHTHLYHKQCLPQNRSLNIWLQIQVPLWHLECHSFNILRVVIKHLQTYCTNGSIWSNDFSRLEICEQQETNRFTSFTTITRRTSMSFSPEVVRNRSLPVLKGEAQDEHCKDDTLVPTISAEHGKGAYDFPQ